MRIIPWRLRFLTQTFFSRTFWNDYFEETAPQGRLGALMVWLRCFLRYSNPNKPRGSAIRLHVAQLGVIPLYTFSDFYHFLEIFVLRTYDLPLSCPPTHIIDVGANVGMFSLRYKKLYPEAHITAYEPVAFNYRRLLENIEPVANGITPKNLGVSDAGGKADIFLHPVNSGAHSLITSENPEQAEKETIELVSIADIMDALPAPIDLLKLDCEGAEFDIVMALRPQDAEQIGTIILEPMFNLYSREDMLGKLDGLGFQHQFQKGLLIATKRDM